MEIFGELFQLLQKQITSDPLFFFLSSLILISAILVVIQQNLVRAGFTLIGCFGAIALLYFSLGAELVAASQILIYAVGITLVVIFAIMLLAGTTDNAEEPKENSDHKIQYYFKQTIAFILPFFSFILMAYAFIGLSSALTPSPPYPPARINGLVQYVALVKQKIPFMPNSLEILGNILLSEQILAFELISLLLLIAFIGAILLSRREI